MTLILIAVSGCLTGPQQEPSYSTEIFKFESVSRGQERSVIAQLSIPLVRKGPLPVILTQHGSNRDGAVFGGGEGKTDEYSSRIIEKGTKRGFAVIALDAFFKTEVKPTDKQRFPDAYQYAVDLKEILTSDPRFDEDSFFYTGFSYGASQVGKSVGIRSNSYRKPWRAVAAAEPGCNVFSQPIKVKFPILIIKGSESHYYLEPCQYFVKMLRDAGNVVTFSIVKDANHFFSTDGRIIRGVAVNGCRYNPVIRMQDGTFQFADGAQATRRLVIKKCFTNEAGAGKNRLLLDGVIDQVINFFETHRSRGTATAHP